MALHLPRPRRPAASRPASQASGPRRALRSNCCRSPLAPPLRAVVRAPSQAVQQRQAQSPSMHTSAATSCGQQCTCDATAWTGCSEVARRKHSIQGWQQSKYEAVRHLADSANQRWGGNSLSRSQAPAIFWACSAAVGAARAGSAAGWAMILPCKPHCLNGRRGVGE